MKSKFTLKPGDRIKLPRSLTLGCRASTGTVIAIDKSEPCYLIINGRLSKTAVKAAQLSLETNEPNQEIFECDHDGVTLIGPPLRGKLARAE